MGTPRLARARHSVWAVIPARGGSVGIPKKNLCEVGGTPLVVRCILAAQKSFFISRVIVSTDDPQIGELASRAGAEIVSRPADLAGGQATSESAILHVLAACQEGCSDLSEITAFLQCSSPFLRPEDIDGTVSALIDQDADSSFAASRNYGFLWNKIDGAIHGINHDLTKRLRRQDRQEEFLEAGSVYAFRTSGFLKHAHRFFGKIAIYEIDQGRTIEIDTPNDLKLAQFLAPYFDF